ncbi:Metallophosphoesterase [Paraburkholderia caribensis]|uniref:metallophosphoesterase family protein n=1 Tax=Paraburkholderia caribensis TaxID=75105 RepID=UPI001CB27745|nr:metallophosphoesterase family protein [Paraburkholderia caribensis]CAG9236630.1 Metallophosphoesterase [Paraburkholderia caribensis]
MRLQIASDLHLELARADPSRYGPLLHAPSDALILAGDIDRIDRVRERFSTWPTPVLYVRGNHDSFFTAYEVEIGKLAVATRNGSFTLLEREIWTRDDIRIIGCCLWTDFALLGRQEDAMLLAKYAGADYRCMWRSDGHLLTPEYTRFEHKLTVEWLTLQLTKPFDGKTVVVTHHAPHFRSLDGRFGRQLIDSAFASDLSALTKYVHLWIHGHVHHSCDYRVKECRVVCNPAGTPYRPNPNFYPTLVVDI